MMRFPVIRPPASIWAMRSNAPKVSRIESTCRMEWRQHIVQLRDRAVVAPGMFEPLTQARKRRAQIMRNIVGDLPHAAHQILDAVEHGIHGFGELIEFVLRATRPEHAATGRPP